MMNSTRELANKKIAILATNGFEESELLKPKQALEAAGADVEIVSLKDEKIKSWKDKNWGTSIAVDKTISAANSEDYDALMLPGGVINADTLRNEDEAVQFVTEFVSAGKPIAAICHGAWILIEAGGVEGREMTSWHSLRTDLLNAGALWADAEVIVDNGWVTSRMPADIPAFNAKMIEEFQEGARFTPDRRRGMAIKTVQHQ